MRAVIFGTAVLASAAVLAGAPAAHAQQYGGYVGSDPYAGSYGSSYTAPYNGGYAGSYGSGYAAPYNGGYAGSYGSGYTAPYNGSYLGSYTGGYTAPYGGSYSSYGAGAASPYASVCASLTHSAATQGPAALSASPYTYTCTVLGLLGGTPGASFASFYGNGMGSIYPGAYGSLSPNGLGSLYPYNSGSGYYSTTGAPSLGTFGSYPADPNAWGGSPAYGTYAALGGSAYSYAGYGAPGQGVPTASLLCTSAYGGQSTLVPNGSSTAGYASCTPYYQ